MDAFLVGSVLSPTDPVFSASLVGNEAVPLRLRRLLNVESGMNDGIALPAVLVFLSIALHDDPPLLTLAGELFGGVAVGVAIPYLVARLERLRWFKRATRFDPLGPLGVTLLVYAVARTTGVNLFLSAFACGITLALYDDRGTRAFGTHRRTYLGAAEAGRGVRLRDPVDARLLRRHRRGGVVFALLMLVAVRPAAILSALARSGSHAASSRSLPGSVLVASPPSPTRSWCSSRVYAGASTLYHLVAVVVVASIIVHSTLDVPVAEWAAGAEVHPDERDPVARDPEPPEDRRASVADGRDVRHDSR